MGKRSITGPIEAERKESLAPESHLKETLVYYILGWVSSIGQVVSRLVQTPYRIQTFFCVARLMIGSPSDEDFNCNP